MWNLGEEAITALTQLPETGMGFQLVEARMLDQIAPLLVFNCKHAVDLGQIGLVPGDDPATVLRNGLRIIETLKTQPIETIFAAPQPKIIRLLNARIGSISQQSGSAVPASLLIALQSSLVKHVHLSANRTFHRFSAFNPDRRVDPLTGSFLPGTYATPDSEVPYVPTGFVAVGRFALPNSLPASFHYEIEAPIGTDVDFGTVAPAFGQAGGGVEAYFANGVTNSKVPPTPVSKMPDE